MDARLRQWLIGILPLTLATTGCSLFDRSTDDLVHGELREARQNMRRPNDPLNVGGTTTVRPQAPDPGGPVAPPPLAPVREEGSPVVAPQPIVPVQALSPPIITPPTTTGPVTPPLLTPSADPVSVQPISPQPLAAQPVSVATPKPVTAVTPVAGVPITGVNAVEARSGPPAETRVKVVATVGPDGLITDDDVLLMMRQRARDYILLTGSERDVKEKEVYREELRRLIERELIITEFLSKIKKNKPGLVDELWEEAGRMADRQIREIRRSAGMTSESEYTQMLQSQGMTAKGFRRQMERTALSNMYLGQYMREKTKTVGLSQIHDYYRDHQELFRVEDRVKWQHMFVNSRQFKTPDEAKLYAEWLLKSLEAKGDFATLAKEYGHGDSGLRGGDGTGTKRGEIQPVELEATVFGLAAGKTSGLITTGNGYHIVRVLERDTAGARPLDEKLQGDIRNKLSDLAFKSERDKMVRDLWRKSTVTVVGE